VADALRVESCRSIEPACMDRLVSPRPDTYIVCRARCGKKPPAPLLTPCSTPNMNQYVFSVSSSFSLLLRVRPCVSACVCSKEKDRGRKRERMDGHKDGETDDHEWNQTGCVDEKMDGQKNGWMGEQKDHWMVPSYSHCFLFPNSFCLRSVFLLIFHLSKSLTFFSNQTTHVKRRDDVTQKTRDDVTEKRASCVRPKDNRKKESQIWAGIKHSPSACLGE